jgi:hypothetical protein
MGLHLWINGCGVNFHAEHPGLVGGWNPQEMVGKHE